MADTTPPVVLAFIQEMISRWKQECPWFFKVWNIIFNVVMFLAALPLVLTFFQISIPELWAPIVNWIVLVSAAVGRVMSGLTIITPSNTSVAQATVQNLPFTAKKATTT